MTFQSGCSASDVNPAVGFAVVAGLAFFVGAIWYIIGATLYANSPIERRREAARVLRLGSRIWLVIGIISAVVALVFVLLD
jgi:predicted membrane channel-forming protein YqfA (hemolysin III family)